MINVEGYKAFRGVLKVSPIKANKPYEEAGEFLYNPHFNCWYGNGVSFPAEVCEAIEDYTK